MLVFSPLAILSVAQVAKKRTVSKGPRAVGLLQIAGNGHARLIPVTIIVNGQFYDAEAYKADPVPMALQFGTVYEAEQAGVSQGLFTVGGAAQTNGNWFADGKWQTHEEIEADKSKAETARARKEQKAPADGELGGPPKLHRGGESSSASTPKEATAPPAEPQSGPTLKRAPGSSDGNAGGETQSSTSDPVDDPNRPVLRRQAPSETTQEQTKASPESEPVKGPIQFIAAVSDANGPEPRPYTFQLKPEEEQSFQKKMLAMAADGVRDRNAKILPASSPEETPPESKTRTAKARTAAKRVAPPQPEFHDVKMTPFDVANSNEAVLVLSASASLPGSDAQFLVALVAREDIYGELHKVFEETTDNKHLDVQPRFDFIDVVDADGDGRGELLFRKTWDSGSAFALYRVIGDRLWPLFEGKPGT
jgi:hypothetical protein